MNRNLMLSLTLGFALFGAGCSAAVEEGGTTDEGSYGLEGTDPGEPGSGETTQTTTGTAPDDPGETEGPTPDPWKSPTQIDDLTPAPGPCPDESPSSSQQGTNTGGN